MHIVKNLNHAVMSFLADRTVLHAERSAIAAAAELLVEVQLNANAK